MAGQRCLLAGRLPLGLSFLDARMRDLMRGHPAHPLLPIRYGRMASSPFAFFRGAALPMASDLARTPRSGLTVQACGDAHLANFGVFASPERNLVFDINDFDETLPGPWEWDVKRLATSLEIAGRANEYPAKARRRIVLAAVAAYRQAMTEFATMRTMDIWYAHLDDDQVMKSVRGVVAETRQATKGAKEAKNQPKAALKDTRKQEKLAKLAAKRAEQTRRKAYSRDSLQALSKLAEFVDGAYRIVSQPPIVVPMRDLAATYGLSPDDVGPAIREQFLAYRATLQDDRRHLLDQFRVVDVARKVVGVGSVGTRAFIVLLQGRDEHDPLFLQVKEATASVLEAYLPRSRHQQHGERVVQGQRMMQAASDIFLGWTRGVDVNRNFYWRQLRDMKGSVLVESMTPVGLTFYARTCGWTLARAHARSGDPVAIGAYLGDGDAFDKSITDFAQRYADQNEQDYEEFVKAIRSGRLEAHEGV